MKWFKDKRGKDIGLKTDDDIINYIANNLIYILNEDDPVYELRSSKPKTSSAKIIQLSDYR